jgi:hypothetical protein
MTTYIEDSERGLSRPVKDAKNKTTKATKDKQKGVNGSLKREAYPGRINTPSEKIYEGYNNSHIVLGKDREDETYSGYGGKGYGESGMVHIVAGHFGAGLGLYSEDINNPVSTNPNFMLDSSYIYISQTADIDKYMSLRDGTVGNSVKKSAIGIKADDIRLVANRGIKLVTSPFSEDSKRQPVLKVKGIDLIAGNDDADLQPMLKGQNTIDAIKEMASLMETFIDIMTEVIHHQANADAANALHQHITNVPGEPTLPDSTEIYDSNMAANYVFTQVSNTKLDLLRKNLGQYKEKFLVNSGEVYIASRFNNTN